MEIGGDPIPSHGMWTCARHGLDGFTVCLGHRCCPIRTQSVDFALRRADPTIGLFDGAIGLAGSGNLSRWKVTLVDTGADTPTGGRLAAVLHDGVRQPMDTPRDEAHREDLWASGQPPRKTR